MNGTLFVEGTQQCLLNESWTTESLAFFSSLGRMYQSFPGSVPHLLYLPGDPMESACVCLCVFVCVRCGSVLCNLQPYGLQPTRLLCPWNFPGKDTAVGCHLLFQGIFLTQESSQGLLHCRQILYQLSCQGSPRNPVGSSLNSTSPRLDSSLFPLAGLWTHPLPTPASRAAQVRNLVSSP